MRPVAFVIGPPAAGKTTISRLVARELGWAYKSIDDWTPRAKRMSDAEVDVALQRLFEDVGTDNELVEFCYHDYASLLSARTYPQFLGSRKILILASLDVCQARNDARSSPVANSYMERSWLSSQALLELDFQEGELGVVDTSSLSVDAAATLVIRWLRDGRGGGNAI